ncbi:MAG: gamma-glutamyltransferase family protein [Gammaproteobacteria bacterium]
MYIRSRSPGYGRKGMVATSQTLATQAGLTLLQRGGSAVDAAIAANAVLSLTEPHMCGPGGDLFAIVWDPADSKLHGLNASGRAPRGLSYAALRDAVGEAGVIPGRGPLAVSTPGAVDGWCTLHERFGRLGLDEVFAPVVDYARNGVAVGSRTAEMWAAAATGILEDPQLDGFTASFRDTFQSNGRTPVAGETHVNPDLADTYALIARQGRDGFYTGAFAEQLSACVRAAGGYLGVDDLAATRCDWVEPVTTNYRGYDVFELPPNGQGMSVLQILNVLETYSVDELYRDPANYWHAFIEAKKLAFEDRARYYADPDAAEVPTATLVSKAYAAERRRLIDDAAAGANYTHGDVAIKSGDTTYLCAADDSGMMVSFIQSIFSPFGAGLVAPGSGFALQCRGAGFTLERDHPNVYAPGKRPFHTIIPGFVLRDGRPWLSFGVMGADMQPQGQVQVLANMIDLGMDPQAAGDAPRMRHFGGSQPNGERLDGLGVVQYEAGIAPATIDALARRGHRLELIEDWISGFTGGYQAIQFDADRQVYVGGSEPRLDGCVLGY